MAYLFVYGTLKRGGSRHSLLKGCPFLGHALAKGFALYDLGAYPGMVPGDGVVRGEVYEIPEKLLRELDWVEGAPFLFRRELIEVVLEDHTPLRAHAYLYNREVEGAALVPSGEWKV
jgi:gamma-glutamylaminecyclotransferase